MKGGHDDLKLPYHQLQIFLYHGSAPDFQSDPECYMMFELNLSIDPDSVTVGFKNLVSAKSRLLRTGLVSSVYEKLLNMITSFITKDKKNMHFLITSDE